jgi:hypothetical protein
MIIIAKLGGYLHRRCDRPPGFECLWKGYAILTTMVKIMQRYHASDSKSHHPIRYTKSVGQAQA